jgi:hypothetical protein
MVTVKSKTQKPKNWYSNRINVVPPPIQLKRVTWSKDADDGAVTSFKLRCNPTDSNSLQYELKVRSFGTGTVEQYILWKRDLDKLIKGQNLERAEDKFEMARKVLEGDALAIFNEKAHDEVVEDDESFKKCLEGLANHVFPQNALTNQKAWLRRSDDVYKKPHIKTRTWVARLNEINLMLKEFPPNFSADQMIQEEDFNEIIEFRIPNTWRAKMVDHSFVPAIHTLAEIIEFCERQEGTEKMLSNDSHPKNGNDTQQSKNNTPKSSSKAGNAHDRSSQGGSKRKSRGHHTSYVDSGGTDGCMVHPTAVDHTSNECRVLQKQVQRLKAKWDAQPTQSQSNKRLRTNHSNSQKGGRQNQNGGDLHTLMGQVERVKESLEKALKQQQTKSGKRKHEENRVKFTEDDNVDQSDEANDPDDNFVCELDQLSSLSDGDIHDLEELEPGQLSE